MTHIIPATPEVMNAVNAWRSFLPRHHQLLKSFTAIPQDQLISNAILGGGMSKDRSDGDALSRSVGNRESLDSFRASPANGLTTILGLARRKSGFHPSAIDDKDFTVAAFQEYLSQLTHCPILQIEQDSIERESVEQSDYNGLIDRISKVIKDGMNSDVESIRESLKKLTETAASKHKADERKNLFVSSIIEGDGNSTLASKKATLAMTFTHVHLVKDDSKGVNVQQSEFAVANVKIVLDGGVWSNFAEPFWNETYESLTDWVNSMRTTPGQNPHNLCIR